MALRRHRSRRPAAERSEISAAVTAFQLTGLAALVLVCVPTVLLFQQVAEQRALTEAVTGGSNLARRLLAPETTSAAIAGDEAALARIDRVVRARMRDGSVARIKIWEASGRVVYSDERSLIGRTYALPAAVSAVLDGQRGVAEIADDADPENALEHDADGLVEVYVPAVASTGERLVFETYFPETAVRRVQHDLLAQMAPVALTALVVLSLAQLPPALRLARRVQRGRRSRERLLAQTLAAGDLERRRLAADLHDAVIQDLAGVGYALSSIHGELDRRTGSVVEQVASTVRRDVGLLRDLVTDLRPARLDPNDVPGALDDLGEALRGQGVRYTVTVDPDLRLTSTQATLVYRVARECVVNARKHAHARGVDVRLARNGSTTLLSVADDGVGFERSSAPPTGHVGLPLTRDIVVEAGGSLSVHSAPGRGTRVDLRLPPG
jgi:signal transduction histidine kinase